MQPAISGAVNHLPILIVDDNEMNRMVIIRALQRHNFQNIMAVDSAQKALDLLDEFKPELLILDIMMPEMDGYECCERIRCNPHYQDLPILVQTALSEPEARVKAFSCGATDFVSKPIFPDELYARVRVHLQNREYLKNLKRYKARIESELESARLLQQSILPQAGEIEKIQQSFSIEIAAHFEPSSEIGGDFWGVKQLSSQQVALWMVDLSGHGVAAAMNAFRLQAHLQEHSDYESLPGDYMSHLNDKLYRLLMRGQFATMFYGVVDAEDDKLHFACACSPHPIIVRATGAELLDGSGLPLGIASNKYTFQSVNFRSGETLILYSDALLETPDSNGNFITENDLLTQIKAFDGDSANNILNRILQYYTNHTGGLITDDLTLSICKRH